MPNRRIHWRSLRRRFTITFRIRRIRLCTNHLWPELVAYTQKCNRCKKHKKHDNPCSDLRVITASRHQLHTLATLILRSVPNRNSTISTTTNLRTKLANCNYNLHSTHQSCITKTKKLGNLLRQFQRMANKKKLIHIKRKVRKTQHQQTNSPKTSLYHFFL